LRGAGVSLAKYSSAFLLRWLSESKERRG